MTEGRDSRQLFDSISYKCLNHLECNEFFDSMLCNWAEGVKAHMFHLWQTRNAPYSLPEDLKAFYLLFDGLNISWRVNLGNNELVTVGNFTLNNLVGFERIPVDGTFVQCNWLDGEIRIKDRNKCSAFVLDSKCEAGLIVLLYVTDQEESNQNGNFPHLLRESSTYPSIWLVDYSNQWHYVSSCFSEYMNLMYSHMGVIGWQEAFTREGLSVTTKHWMALFCKERLCIDEYHYCTSKALLKQNG